MPNYNDLQDIKDKIQDIGDEKNILDEKGLPASDSPMPEEEKSAPENKEENVVEEENLLGDILEDFEKGNVIKEEESLEIESGEDENEPLSEDQFGFEDIPEESGKKEEGINSEEYSDLLVDNDLETKEDLSIKKEGDEYKDEGLDALLGKGFDEEKELEDFEIMQQKGDEGESAINGFGDIIEEQEQKKDKEATGDEELDALLNIPYEEESEKTSLAKEGEESAISDEFSDLLVDNGLETKEKSSDEEILDKIGKEEVKENFDELPDLESLLGEESGDKDFAQEEIKEELGLEEKVKDEIEASEFLAEEDKELKGIEDIFEDETSFLKEDDTSFLEEDSSSREEATSLGIEGEKAEPEESGKVELESKEEEIFDLADIGKFGVEGVDEFPSIESEEEELIGTAEQELKDSTYGEIPDEISKEDIKVDQDIDLKLSENERKQIVITLTTLPKLAEIKISKAIISNKYSNHELKPLINSLINKEPSQVIIKYYEKITKDKSLSKVEGIKYTGEKFEERKKSLSYFFEKNILPFIAKALAVIAVCGLFLLFIITVIKPTVVASSLYKEGIKLIESKEFEKGEEKFKEAFNEQPRFREAVKYARKYREHKRYLATEEKYELARSMKPGNDDITLEYTDFLREKKDFERAERMYKSLIKSERKKLEATLGLAKTYYDWGEEEAGKYEDAKESYKDALEIDRNNREAIFGNLNIYIKQKNHKEILSHYNYIERKFRWNVDPEVYTNLAEYFINMDEVNEAKNVLDKASRSIKKDQYIPEIQYQYARYKKYLNVYNEEKVHLTNALSILEKMKENDASEFESDKNKRLLSNVYNDLGENAETSTQASPEAERFYRKAIEVDENYGKPYYNLANFALKYKPDGYIEAKPLYVKAEKNGYVNDRLDYNLGWLYFKEGNYFESYNRITRIFDNQPENSNLKFMIGTIFYKLGKYELSESILLENYIHFMDLSEVYYPLDTTEKEDRMIMEMLKKTANNLGASYQKRFEETRNSRYLIKASKYYADSIIYFDKLENIYETEIDAYNPEKNIEESNLKGKKGNANINFRMVLYPYAGIEDPILYEDFPFDFTIFM